MLPSAFYDLTRAEFIMMRDGYVERKRRDINEARHQAWHTAHWILHRDAPELEKYLITDKRNDAPKEEPRQTNEQILARVKLLNAMLGGTEVRA